MWLPCSPPGSQPTPRQHARNNPPLSHLEQIAVQDLRPQLEHMFLPADGTEEAAEGGEQTEGVLGVQGEALPSSLSRAPARALSVRLNCRGGEGRKPHSELRAESGAQRCCCLGDRPGLRQRRTDNEIPPNDKPRATGQDERAYWRKGRLQLLAPRPRCQGAVKSSPSWPENRGLREARRPAVSQRTGQLFRGRKAASAPRGPAARAPGTEGRPNRLTMAGGAVPSRQRVVALQPDPGWAITWGRGRERKRQRLQHGSAQPGPSASPRLLYKPARNNES